MIADVSVTICGVAMVICIAMLCYIHGNKKKSLIVDVVFKGSAIVAMASFPVMLVASAIKFFS